MKWKALVSLTGASLLEGGWREPSNVLEPLLGGGSGEWVRKGVTQPAQRAA
jgi:hypothetical protein